MSDDTGQQQNAPAERDRPTLNSAVLRRRADQEFFLRLREVMQQNHKALERLAQ